MLRADNQRATGEVGRIPGRKIPAGIFLRCNVDETVLNIVDSRSWNTPIE